MSKQSITQAKYTRRAFLGTGTLAALALAGCSRNRQTELNEKNEDRIERVKLPDAEPDETSEFGVDKNVNMDTIDKYLVSSPKELVFRDMRMLNDPANYAAVGGNSQLDISIEGFKITPFPFIGTLRELPVEGAYSGEQLFEITWDDDGGIAAAKPRFSQSLQILEDLFPRDKYIALICGGAGYAAMMKSLLVYLGWDAARIYNAGGAWYYTGDFAVQLISHDDKNVPTYYLWRADIANIDFSQYDRL